MNSKHLSKTAEQYTPLWLIERGREVLGGKIDLDPASTAAVNAEIGARKFFTKRDDGLSQHWGTRQRPSSVFVNPPGGQFSPRQAKQIGTRSKQVAFWCKLMDELHHGHVRRAMFLSFSVELLQACQRALPSVEYGWYPLDFPWCIPAKRIKFEKIIRGQRVVGKQPSHANILIFPGCKPLEVKRVFGDLGRTGHWILGMPR